MAHERSDDTRPPSAHEPEGAATPRVPDAPSGWKRLAWLGPGILWLVSAAGSGELLFTPRIGALYGYALVWALVAAVSLKWFINREVGRYTACTGRKILEGFQDLPGPRGWPLWLILVPQVFVAIATIAGLGSGAATALVLVLPGSVLLWTAVSIGAAAALVVYGRYGGVEKAATAFAILLALVAVAAALSVGPGYGELARGAVPAWPAEAQAQEVLPWLGFMLSGAAGMIWYSYWIRAKGYGLAGTAEGARDEGRHLPSPKTLPKEDRERLRLWVRQMTLDNTVAVVGTLIITLAFLVLGVELLRPAGVVPEESRVAEVLGRLLGGVWGAFGFWFMVLGVFVGFWSTVLSDQDGFGRMFANGTRMLLGKRVPPKWRDEHRLKNAYVIVLVALVPLALYALVGEPVRLLQAAGAIEAAHIPVVAGLTLYLNRRELPDEVKPSWPVTVMTGLAGAFFAGFAIYYLVTLLPQVGG